MDFIAAIRFVRFTGPNNPSNENVLNQNETNPG